ncbi:unnamed protein product [Ixodes persulcatus]
MVGTSLLLTFSQGMKNTLLLRVISKCCLSINVLQWLPDSLGLHRVENPSHSEQAVSLHLYCPPFDQCLMFDQRTGHKSVSKVTFWSKFGERTPFVSATCTSPFF